MRLAASVLLALLILAPSGQASDSCQKEICGMNSYRVAKEDAQGHLLLDSAGKRIYEERTSIFDLEEWSTASRFDEVLIRKSSLPEKASEAELSGLRLQLEFEAKETSVKIPPRSFELEEADLDTYLEVVDLDFQNELRAFSEKSGKLPVRFTLTVLRKGDSKVLLSQGFRVLPLH